MSGVRKCIKTRLRRLQFGACSPTAQNAPNVLLFAQSRQRPVFTHFSSYNKNKSNNNSNSLKRKKKERTGKGKKGAQCVCLFFLFLCCSGRDQTTINSDQRRAYISGYEAMVFNHEHLLSFISKVQA